jgi:hypothetical protein
MSTDERLKILREAAPDTWIAFSADESRVVGRGSSYSEAVEQAAKQGEKEPVLLKTPADWSVKVFCPCA